VGYIYAIQFKANIYTLFHIYIYIYWTLMCSICLNVFMCMCPSASISMSLCPWAHACVHVSIILHKSVSVCSYNCLSVCLHVSVSVWICVLVSAPTSVFLGKCFHMCVCVILCSSMFDCACHCVNASLSVPRICLILSMCPHASLRFRYGPSSWVSMCFCVCACAFERMR
jgi:hypothetical protein